MAWDDIPRTHSFSLGDFHDYDKCVFRFFVNHHLEKKYELAEGNPNQVIGSLLDIIIKKIHLLGAYDQPLGQLLNLVKSAEMDIRQDIANRGLKSFYGAQAQFLTAETVQKAQEVFASYHQKIGGKYKKMVATETTKKIKPFWQYLIKSDQMLKVWGGPDAIEMGDDGVPEVVDYKYFEDGEKGQTILDMDLMPKIYILLTAKELLDNGFPKARFRVKLWQDPLNESFYEEFDLSQLVNLENYFKDKIERILRTIDLTFCDKDYCRVCKSDKRDVWIAELKAKGFIQNAPEPALSLVSSDLPF